MRTFGIDFTSRPSRRKPIACSAGVLSEGRLRIDVIDALPSFDAFENQLAADGPWIAGIDLPFGQARRLVEDLGWPTNWAEYVSLVGSLSKAGFVEALESYKRHRRPGDKEHRRKTDKDARSLSPQKLYGVPVGKMFFEGAPRVLNSGASVIPVCPRDSSRRIFEAYPALVARRWSLTKRCSYKSDTRSKQTATQRRQREEIFKGVVSSRFAEVYGFAVEVAIGRDEVVDDATGDRLDALLCAVQAAWAWTQKDDGFGVSKNADSLEGAIVDPALR